MRKTVIYFIAAGLGIALGATVALTIYKVQEPKNQAFHELLHSELRAPDQSLISTKAWQNKVLVINFWASWCPPCVEEMPLFVRYQDSYASKNVLFVGIGIDSPSNIREFLTKTPVNYPIVLGGLEGSQWAKNFGNPTGGLPFTLIINAKGQILKTKLGKMTEDELKSALDSAILAKN